MGLLISQRFGSNATVDTTTDGEPKLVINLNDLRDSANGGDMAGGLGLDDPSVIDANNADDWSEKVFAALLLLNKQNQPESNTDNTLGVFIEDFRKRFFSRNGTAQIEYSYPVNVYVNDVTTVFDPDDTTSG